MTPARPFKRGDRPLSGLTGLRGILGEVVEELGCRIVGGEWAPGEAIPREADIGEALGVSRSVVREAFRILGAKGLIRSRTSDGTRVLPRRDWRLLDPDVMDWRIRAGDTTRLLEDLLLLRLALEPGVARLAASRSDETAREAVARAWKAKVDVLQRDASDPMRRRDAFIETDLAFHEALLEAAGSDLLLQLYTVIEAAMRLLLDLQMRARGYTSEAVGMEQSQELHAAVFEAFMAGDADRTEAAMRSLIEHAIRDARDGLAAIRGRDGA